MIKQGLLEATGPVLLQEFLPSAIRDRRPADAAPAMDLSGLTDFIHRQLADGTTTLYADYQALTDRHLLTEVMNHAKGNLSHAAKTLGIARGTLRAKLDALSLSAPATDDKDN